MAFALTEENLVQYLASAQLIDRSKHTLVDIDCCSSKNFNLVATFSDQSSLLVKQKRLNDDGEFRRDFYDEWRVCHLMQTFSPLSSLIPLTSEVLHYDPENAILVSKFFVGYQDLRDFHDETNQYPSHIGTAMGGSLAQIHRRTYRNSSYCDFLLEGSDKVMNRTPSFLNRFDRIKPDIFGTYCLDGIEFFRVLQRSAVLTEAIASLKHEWQASCLIHRDLKLDNLILHSSWPDKNLSTPIVKIIDWELFTWGDPLYDLGTLVGSYLMQWLSTLIVQQGLSMQQSLRLADTPLELVQPILIALLRSYGRTFPELVEERSNFWQLTLQYAGFFMFRRMVHHLSRHAPFDQKSLCSLQIIKRLLCDPELSFASIIGCPLGEFEATLARVAA